MYNNKILKIMLKTTYKNNYKPTQIKTHRNDAGESIEEQLRRLTTNKEPIPQEVPPMYTPMKDGVLADTDIRTDRFDIAYDATDKFAASDTARSEERLKYEPKDEVEQQND